MKFGSNGNNKAKFGLLSICIFAVVIHAMVFCSALYLIWVDKENSKLNLMQFDEKSLIHKNSMPTSKKIDLIEKKNIVNTKKSQASIFKKSKQKLLKKETRRKSVSKKSKAFIHNYIRLYDEKLQAAQSRKNYFFNLTDDKHYVDKNYVDLSDYVIDQPESDKVNFINYDISLQNYKYLDKLENFKGQDFVQQSSSKISPKTDDFKLPEHNYNVVPSLRPKNDIDHLAKVKNNRADLVRSQDQDNLIKKYRIKITKMIQQNMSYPNRAIDFNMFKKGTVKLILLSDGSLVSVSIVKSSGSHILDSSFVGLVNSLAPYPKWSDDLSSQFRSLSFVVDFKYSS